MKHYRPRTEIRLPSEAKRGFIRITSNYTRLLTTFVLGLFLVRLQLLGLGEDGLALITLLGSTVGLAAMLQVIVASSMVRELGSAHHSNDQAAFLTTYNSALVLSLVIATISAVLFAIIWLILPLLNVPPELLGPARWLVFAKGAETFAVIAMAPAFNMYKITERMVAHNLFTTLGRASYFAVALILFGLLGLRDPARGLTLFAIISSAIFILTQCVGTLLMVIGDRRLLPRPRLATRAATRSIIGVGGWNSLFITAMQLHFPVDALVMNLVFGLRGNLIWGLASQMTSYVRMLTVGMTEGVEAVAARVSTVGTNRAAAVRQLAHQSTRLHGLVAFPAALTVIVFAEPLLNLWIGDRIDQATRAENLAFIATLVRVLSIGLLIRAISDNWQHILYGAGFVKDFALYTLAGGLLNPFLAVALIWILPESIDYTGPAVGYSFIMFVFHFILLPLAAARKLETRYFQLLSGLARPALVTLACAGIYLIAVILIERWTIIPLAITLAIFGLAYGLGALWFILSRAERERITRAIHRRRTPTTTPPPIEPRP